MLGSLIVLALIAVIAFTGWMLAEDDNRDLRHVIDDLEQECRQLEYERDVAEGWEVANRREPPRVHPTLYAIDGDEA